MAEHPMKLRFTKMQGAGNDFVVIDAVRQPVALDAAGLRRLADRHFGVGADQVLLVEPARAAGVDFRYRIFNADGGEVEQCGNGARCFARFVRDAGLTDRDAIRVETLGGVIEPRLAPDGRVTVDMGAPAFDPARVPFDPAGLASRQEGDETLWLLDLTHPADGTIRPAGAMRWLSVVSMGNPHAVQAVADVDAAPVGTEGAAIELHERFPQRVNAGFMQIVARDRIRLRVFERGTGETLACGSGACAAVVAGIRRGLLDAVVDVEMRGGLLTVEWHGASVLLTGPAVRVFDGEIEL